MLQWVKGSVKLKLQLVWTWLPAVWLRLRLRVARKKWVAMKIGWNCFCHQ